jgi:hypothetical protein
MSPTQPVVTPHGLSPVRKSAASGRAAIHGLRWATRWRCRPDRSSTCPARECRPGLARCCCASEEDALSGRCYRAPQWAVCTPSRTRSRLRASAMRRPRRGRYAAPHARRKRSSEQGLRQERGRKCGGTGRTRRPPTDGPGQPGRTFPQVTAHRARDDTGRMKVGLPCKQVVRVSSPLAGSHVCTGQRLFPSHRDTAFCRFPAGCSCSVCGGPRACPALALERVRAQRHRVRRSL